MFVETKAGNDAIMFSTRTIIGNRKGYFAQAGI